VKPCVQTPISSKEDEGQIESTRKDAKAYKTHQHWEADNYAEA
jgi:hypothetical protein